MLQKKGCQRVVFASESQAFTKELHVTWSEKFEFSEVNMTITLKATNSQAKAIFFKNNKGNSKMMKNKTLHINMNYKTFCFLQIKSKTGKVSENKY